MFLKYFSSKYLYLMKFNLLFKLFKDIKQEQLEGKYPYTMTQFSATQTLKVQKSNSSHCHCPNTLPKRERSPILQFEGCTSMLSLSNHVTLPLKEQVFFPHPHGLAPSYPCLCSPTGHERQSQTSGKDLQTVPSLCITSQRGGRCHLGHSFMHSYRLVIPRSPVCLHMCLLYVFMNSKACEHT